MKIYLAGFEVFYPEAIQHGEKLKGLCKEFGFEGLFPMDNTSPKNLQGADLARWIYKANLDLIHQADLVMANINDFRGHEPDSGTCFEIGYATALGKPVWAYTEDGRSLVEQLKVKENNGIFYDTDGYVIEDFGWSRNLMLCAAATVVVGDARACLVAIAKG